MTLILWSYPVLLETTTKVNRAQTRSVTDTVVSKRKKKKSTTVLVPTQVQMYKNEHITPSNRGRNENAPFTIYQIVLYLFL